MHGKRLLAVSAVLAILACGACFLPPLPVHHRSMAPGVLLRGSRCIRVAVMQRSASPAPEKDARALADGLAKMIDARASLTHMRMCSEGDEGPGAAVLRMTMDQERVSAEPAPNRPLEVSTTYSVALYGVLTASDGVIVWHDDGGVITSPRYFHARSEGNDAWSDSGQWLEEILAPMLVRQMMDGK